MYIFDKNGKWINFVGFFLLLVCYGGAIWNVISIHRREHQAQVIRMAHWQLEIGVREGLDRLIDQFEIYQADQGQKVDVVQIPIPEQVYPQYVTTQLIGGTAPDLIQIGKFPEEYLSRYFRPLSPELQQPNPYLKKRYVELSAMKERTSSQEDIRTVLERFAPQPWKNSFTDGMRSMYQEDQEYYGVGFTTFTIRMFYNKDLFQEILGHENPPTSYTELIGISRELEAYSEESGRSLYPIASSRYQVNLFRFRLLGNLTANLVRDFDLDYSGHLDGIEKLAAILQGSFTPWSEEYMAATVSLKELAAYFPKGFMALGREDSSFDFVQGKAAMILSGSWDANSLVREIERQPADRRFRVGFFDIPLLTKGHEKYGHLVDGRTSEASTNTAFAFGVTLHTKQQDLCVEFLQFATTPERNTEFNETAGWIPVVHGAVPGTFIRNFLPNYVGYFGGISFEIMSKGKAALMEKQLFWPYISGDMDYGTYARNVWDALPEAAATDYTRMYDGIRETMPNRNLRRSAVLADMTFGGTDHDTRIKKEIQYLRHVQVVAHALANQQKMDRMITHIQNTPPDSPEVKAFHAAFFQALNKN